MKIVRNIECFRKMSILLQGFYIFLKFESNKCKLYNCFGQKKNIFLKNSQEKKLLLTVAIEK